MKNAKFLGGMLIVATLALSLVAPDLISRAVSAGRTASAMPASVVGSAGAPVAGADIRSNGTLAQSTPIGIASGSGKILYAGFWGGRIQVVTAAETPETPPLQTALLGNSPNPFNPRTRIEFELAKAGPVRLEVFNAKGQLVRTLLSEDRAAGHHGVTWDGTDRTGRRAASGVYFYRLRTGDHESVKKMLMLK